MKSELQMLHHVWSLIRPDRESERVIDNFQISFSELANSIVSTGTFYFYIIDFYDMSISHVSPLIVDLHGFDSEKITLDDIVNVIHPEDMEFVINAEKYLSEFFLNTLSWDKLLTYKNSYNFRAKLKNDTYGLFNHQSILLTLGERGVLGKSLNIHTHIDHLARFPNYKISSISLHGESSYMNVNINNIADGNVSFTKREIDIIKNISDGLSSVDISRKLFISELTVKKHRNNILLKANCSNTAQLIKTCILQGLI